MDQLREELGPFLCSRGIGSQFAESDRKIEEDRLKERVEEAVDAYLEKREAKRQRKREVQKGSTAEVKPGKECKGDAALLKGRSVVSFRTVEEYLGLGERQRQHLVQTGALTVEGKGQNRKITTESLRKYMPAENPK